MESWPLVVGARQPRGPQGVPATASPFYSHHLPRFELIGLAFGVRYVSGLQRRLESHS